MTADTGTLERTDTGTHAVVRVIDPGVHESAPYSRAIGIATLHDIDQWAGATIDRAVLGVKRRFYSDLDRIIADCLDGARLPKQQPTAEDLLARRHDQEATREWPLFAELPDDEINESSHHQSSSGPDPVQAYFDADDPDERPGRTVVLAPRDNPLAQAYARTAGHAQRQDAIRRAAEQGTATGQYVAPALRPRGPRNPVARRVDGLFARVETWWRAKQAQRDQRMGVDDA